MNPEDPLSITDENSKDTSAVQSHNSKAHHHTEGNTAQISSYTRLLDNNFNTITRDPKKPRNRGQLIIAMIIFASIIIGISYIAISRDAPKYDGAYGGSTGNPAKDFASHAVDRMADQDKDYQRRSQDTDRQNNLMRTRLLIETYFNDNFSGAERYPSLAELNDPAFRQANNLDISFIPEGTATTFVDKPEPGAIAYIARPIGCNNTTVLCKGYQLVTILSTGKQYMRESVNNGEF